jgi:mRNA interferase MazF
MHYKRGGIYLARLNPARGAEPGKVRPVLILQADSLTVVGHSTVVIVPLTTNLIDDAFPLRYRITGREKLQQDSDLLCDQIRAIDIRRLGNEEIASLSDEEMLQVETQIALILDLAC